MGAVLGVADHFEYPVKEPLFFGGSGAAFQLEYSGAPGRSPGFGNPPEGIRRLLPNLGVEYRDLGCFGPDVTATERNRLESGVRKLISMGMPCGLNRGEYQLIRGFDEEGFLLDSPPSTPDNLLPGRLSFGCWEEFTPGEPISFQAFRRVARRQEAVVFRESLGFLSARNSSTGNPGDSLNVYDLWIRDFSAMGDRRDSVDFGALAECRGMASAFLKEAAGLRPEISGEALGAAELMESVSRGFRLLAEGTARREAADVLAELKHVEREFLRGVERIAGAFRH